MRSRKEWMKKSRTVRSRKLMRMLKLVMRTTRMMMGMNKMMMRSD